MTKSHQLKNRWKDFTHVILDPIVLFPLIVSVVVFFLSLNQDNRSTQALFNILLSVSTGLAGGILAKRWDDIASEGLIQARGTVSVRSLNLLLSHINRLARRTREYIEQSQSALSKKLEREVVILYLKEILDRSEALMEEVLSSINNWTDIVPEANIGTQFDLIQDHRSEVERLEAKLAYVIDESKDSEDLSKTKIASLEKDKARFRKELEKARAELRQGWFDARPTFQSTGSLLSSDSDAGFFPGASFLSSNMIMCKKCAWMFHPSDPVMTCPSCGTANHTAE